MRAISSSSSHGSYLKPHENLKVHGRLDYASFKYTDLNDIPARAKTDTYIGNNMGAFVLTYNTKSFGAGNHPRSWREFWDVGKFPGTRTLAGMSTGTPNLEFALLADGVPKEKIYPIDIARAFRPLQKYANPFRNSGIPAHFQPI